MGAVCSSSPEDAAAAAASNAIDKSAGDTGKSTILKQLKVIYAAGFSEEEKRVFRSAIYFNITLCATTLVAAMDKLKIPYGFDPTKAIECSDEQYLSNQISAAESSPHLSASVPHSVNNSTNDVFHLASKDPLANWAERCYRESGNAKGQRIPKEAEIVKSLDPTFGYRMGESIPEDVLNAIKVIWADSGIQYCAHRSNEFQIMDNCSL
ncbi:hypothetical protein HDU79_004309 [Rhizoclosmatium sp. JEL0117]|nr:hypothetical protein HDU79_004309 [Rhizoclosmatium sp. JEL0117]